MTDPVTPAPTESPAPQSGGIVSTLQTMATNAVQTVSSEVIGGAISFIAGPFKQGAEAMSQLVKGLTGAAGGMQEIEKAAGQALNEIASKGVSELLNHLPDSVKAAALSEKDKIAGLISGLEHAGSGAKSPTPVAAAPPAPAPSRNSPTP